MLKKYAAEAFESWVRSDIEQVLSLIEPAHTIVDLGCGNGVLTKKFAAKAKAKKVVKVDAVTKGAIRADFNKPLPFKDNTFDAVIAHFVFEHLYNTGVFLSETHRILKKDGYIIIATDNIASWPNIIALLLGWQPFTTAIGITDRSIGNPFSLKADIADFAEKPKKRKGGFIGEYSHNKVLAYRALVEAFEEYGFKVEAVKGAGYFPFGGKVAEALANFDKRHAHFFILKARKI